MALDISRNLWTFGRNNEGQLGRTGSTNIPMKTNLSNIVTMAGGYRHSIFLDTSSNVWVIGNNINGQLGNATYTNITQFTKANVPGVQAIDACGILQQLVNAEVEQLNLYICGLVSQNALLAPMVELVQVIENPTAAVTWINNFITSYLTPQLAVYEAYAQQVIVLAAQITALTEAIVATEQNIANCSITIPTILPLPSFG
jgi:hypothetical protein